MYVCMYLGAFIWELKPFFRRTISENTLQHLRQIATATMKLAFRVRAWKLLTTAEKEWMKDLIKKHVEEANPNVGTRWEETMWTDISYSLVRRTRSTDE